MDLIAWSNPVELVATFRDSAALTWVRTVNVETGAERDIAQTEYAAVSHAAGWVLCDCRRRPADPRQVLVISVAQPDRVLRVDPTEAVPYLTLFPSGRAQPYLHRLEIERPDTIIPEDGSWRLRVRGWDAAEEEVSPWAISWHSGDTLTAAVDSTGRVRPRRRGEVTIRATSGGWRSDSVTIRIGPAQTSTVFTERWGDSIEPRWVRFGEPRPYQIAQPRPALATNGDSSYWSGVFTRELLPTEGGLGLEYEASTPLTLPQWQFLSVGLIAAESLDTRRWDLVRGHLPNPDGIWRSCGAAYPTYLAEGGAPSMAVFGGTRQHVPAPAGTERGQWINIRVQFFPDGRCGVAINGEPVALFERPVALGTSAMLLIYSFSHGTRILVGPLDVWRGVRRDVDWEAARQPSR